MRIDKFIWAMRFYKTRSIATKNCIANNVKLNDLFVKPSKDLAIGDTVSIKTSPIWKEYKVIAIPRSRLGAKLLVDYILETTSKEDLSTLETAIEYQNQMRRDGFKGRPTKRDRRKLDRLTD